MNILSGIFSSLPTQLYEDLIAETVRMPAFVGDVKRQLLPRLLRFAIAHVHLDELEDFNGLFLDQLIIRTNHGLLNQVLLDTIRYSHK